MELSVRSLLDPRAQERPRATYLQDLITVGLGVWFVLGLFLDAWAHNNLPELESFFTPWHAVFYTGFVAVAAWIIAMVWRNWRRRDPAGLPTVADVPLGYALGVVGIPLFAAAGLGDLVWHSVFGIEQNLNILFSPTHLLLVGSMILIVTSPLRAAWADPALPGAPSLRRLLPALLALASATALVLLIIQYGNALTWEAPWIVSTLSEDGGGSSANELVLAIAVSNVVLLSPLLLLARRWRVPPGSATILYLAVAGLAGAITEARSPAVLAALVAAGACLDGLLAWLRPRPAGRGAQLAFAALAPLVTWSLYVGFASAAEGGLPTVVEFWTGIPVVAAFQGLLLGVLVGGAVASIPDLAASGSSPSSPRMQATSAAGD
jgi:hypothetical protein